MKTKILIVLITFSISNIFAQTKQADSLTYTKDIEIINKRMTSLENDLIKFKENINQKSNQEFNILKKHIDSIQQANNKLIQEYELLKNSQLTLKHNYKKLNNRFETYKQNIATKLDRLKQTINNNSANIEKTTKELGVKIENTQEYTDQNITALNKNVSKNTLYWVIAILIVAVFVILIFITLRKQIFKQKTDLISNIEETRKALEEESIKLDNKLIEVLETQLKILNNSNTKTQKDETDHSLALKVADEIVRIEKNIAKMESNTKGIKPLVKGIERIKDNFKANGYEMVQLLEVEYSDGMNIDVINFIDDENIPEGKRIITKIIKPQVNYNGVLIQRAQVDVSQN